MADFGGEKAQRNLWAYGNILKFVLIQIYIFFKTVLKPMNECCTHLCIYWV